MHTDITLDIMDAVTTDLGEKFRAFQQNTCKAFQTKELRREFDARMRRQNRKKKVKPDRTSTSAQASDTTHSVAPPSSVAGLGQSSGLQSARPNTSTESNFTTDHSVNNQPNSKLPTSKRRPKTFNLNTYKHHALGDYVSTIRKYGTTDSYSTEPVCIFFIPLCFINWRTTGRVGASHCKI
jgi:hypothetical protein